MVFSNNAQLLIYQSPTDMRKAVNGLSALVVEAFKQPLQSNTLFIFYNKRYDRLKILFWHYNGFCLLSKRLEKGQFKIPKNLPDNLQLEAKQLEHMLEGLHVITFPEFRYDCFV